MKVSIWSKLIWLIASLEIRHKFYPISGLVRIRLSILFLNNRGSISLSVILTPSLRSVEERLIAKFFYTMALSAKACNESPWSERAFTYIKSLHSPLMYTGQQCFVYYQREEELFHYQMSRQKKHVNRLSAIPFNKLYRFLLEDLFWHDWWDREETFDAEFSTECIAATTQKNRPVIFGFFFVSDAAKTRPFFVPLFPGSKLFAAV